jgi:MerR family copper efflux transcriptional regulator
MEMPVNISEAARRSGLSSKTIRYYEDIGLLGPAPRNANGYRQYDTRALGELRFLGRARQVGFDLEEARQLLNLLHNKHRQSAHARNLVLDKSRELQLRIEQLQDMQQVLAGMAARCNGDEGPECAILDELIHGEGAAHE